MGTTLNISPGLLQYHVLSKKWESDLEFFSIETAFFHRLLDDYFTRLSVPKYSARLKAIGRRLYELEQEESELAAMLDGHLKHLQLIVENTIAREDESLADMHATLEQMFSKFFGDYRDLKKQLFALAAEEKKNE